MAIAKAVSPANAQTNALVVTRLILKISAQHRTKGYISATRASDLAFTDPEWITPHTENAATDCRRQTSVRNADHLPEVVAMLPRTPVGPMCGLPKRDLEQVCEPDAETRRAYKELAYQKTSRDYAGFGRDATAVLNFVTVEALASSSLGIASKLSSAVRT